MRTVTCLLATLVAVSQTSGCAKSDSHRFEDSVLAAVAANGISFALPSVQRQDGQAAAQKKETEMIALMEKSLVNANAVSDSFLETLHPQLKEPYRRYLVQGQVLYLEGLRSGDTAKQVSATRLMMVWGEFWDRNKKLILDRLK